LRAPRLPAAGGAHVDKADPPEQVACVADQSPGWRVDEIQNVGIAAPEPFVELLVGLVGLVVTIFVHGSSIRFITRYFSDRWVNVTAETPLWKVNLLLGVTIAALSVTHLLETLIWAVPISTTGMIPAMRDSYFFVLESYTTLGSGNVALPERWRLIGPIIAMSGLFTFSWTAGVLVSVMNEFGKLDRARAARTKDKPGRERAEPPF
jgi:hypothetical protein